MTRLYLAGPMSGLADLNRQAFDAAAARLRADGFEVVSPVDLSIEVAGTWEAAKARNADTYQDFLARDLEEVARADGVVFLPGWEMSNGARAEARYGLVTLAAFYLYDATRSPALEAIPSSRVATVVHGSVLLSNGDAATSFLPPLAVDVAAGAYDGDRWVNYEDNPLRHVFGSGGIKDNRGKAPIDLLPSRPLVAIAEILAFGAKKYRPHNWRRGLPWGDTYASLMRHLLAWNDGEDLDKETGQSHLAHAGCQLLFLLDYVLTGVGEDTDNRFIQCRIEGCDAHLHPTTDHQLKETA